MATGRNNQVAKQIGEYLVACELARRNLLFATFSGNVPDFDLIATGTNGASCPIQVKTSMGGLMVRSSGAGFQSNKYQQKVFGGIFGGICDFAPLRFKAITVPYTIFSNPCPSGLVRRSIESPEKSGLSFFKMHIKKEDCAVTVLLQGFAARVRGLFLLCLSLCLNVFQSFAW